MLPELKVTIDGIPTDVMGLQYSMSAGYESASGVIAESDVRRLPSSIEQGSLVTVTAGGRVRYQGSFVANPKINGDGTASFEVMGAISRAANEQTDLLYQAAGTGWWTDRDGDPHGYASFDDKFNLDINPGSVKIWAPNGTTLNPNESHGVVAWFPECLVTRVAWTLAGIVSATFEHRIHRSTGPSGARIFEQTFTSPGSLERVLSIPSDQVDIQFNRLSSATTVATNVRQLITNLRVNGRADNRNGNRDIFYASDVYHDLATLLGYDSSGVQDMLTNILPLYWQDGSWADLMHAMDILTDGWHNVLDDRGSGPYVEADTWASAPVFTVNSSNAIADVSQLPKYNRCTVHYQDITGRPRQVIASGAVAELDSRGLVNNYRIELSEPQRDATLATSVANTVVGVVSQEQREGTIRFTDAIDSAGRSDPYGPKPGCILRFTDDDAGESFDYRATGFSYDQDGGSASVGGAFPPTDQIIGLQELIDARKRRPYRKLKRAIFYTGKRARQYRAYLATDAGPPQRQTRTPKAPTLAQVNRFRRQAGKRRLSRKQYRRRFH